MKEPLIIYFHDEIKMEQNTDSSFLNTISGIAAKRSFPVSNIGQFSTLLQYLPSNQEVYVYVHIMGDLQAKNPEKDFEGVAWGIALDLEYPNCNYYFVTTNIAKKTENIDGRKVHSVNDLFRSSNRDRETYPPQTVKDIIGTHRIEEASLDRDKKDIDFVIMTALYYDELEEIKTAFKIKPKAQFNLGKNVGYFFTFNNYRIVATSQPEMGMVESAILASECIMRFNPRYIIMPGVCGGDKKTEFGDIIIPTKIHLFQSGKLTEAKFDKDVVDVKIESKILERIKPVEKLMVKEIFNEIKRTKSKNDKFSVFLNKPFSAKLAPMACSTMVVDKKDYFDTVIKEIDRKMVAVEMESYGVARAAEHFENRTVALFFKCVMDKTTKKKDIAKQYAAYISARFVKKIIEQKILD